MLIHHVYETKMINYNVSVLYISVLFVLSTLFRNKLIDDFIMPMKTVSLYLTVLFLYGFHNLLLSRSLKKSSGSVG